ncbi:MAG: PIN domain-containing protein [Caldilineaceae bacterium]|nr:PIN domain-containing protein [Caldilineaceae bacterium]HRJ40725.1 PIN domain-containing protein [Caldilineaceae bacterium]
MTTQFSRVFIDTSFFIALLNSNDADHPRALQLHSQLIAYGSRKVTSEYVLMELGDGLSRLRFRHLAAKLLEAVRADATIEIVPASPGWFAKSVSLFKDRVDKEWGLTDCSSFVIMREKGIAIALTADHHFQQAGYRALMLEDDT